MVLLIEGKFLGCSCLFWLFLVAVVGAVFFLFVLDARFFGCVLLPCAGVCFFFYTPIGINGLCFSLRLLFWLCFGCFLRLKKSQKVLKRQEKSNVHFFV